MTNQNDEELNNFLNQMTTLTSTWGDGIQRKWYYFHIPCKGTKFAEMSFEDIICEMVNFYICPKTRKMVVIIKGASDLFYAIAKIERECKYKLMWGHLALCNLKKVTTRSLDNKVKDRTEELNKRMSASKELKVVLRQTAGHRNASGQQERYLCPDCGTGSRRYQLLVKPSTQHTWSPSTKLNQHCPECNGFVQQHGYLVIHDKYLISMIMFIFELNKCYKLNDEQFKNASKYLLATILNM